MRRRVQREVASNLSKLREAINLKSNLSWELIFHIYLWISQGLKRKVSPAFADNESVPLLSLEISSNKARKTFQTIFIWCWIPFVEICFVSKIYAPMSKRKDMQPRDFPPDLIKYFGYQLSSQYFLSRTSQSYWERCAWIPPSSYLFLSPVPTALSQRIYMENDWLNPAGYYTFSFYLVISVSITIQELENILFIKMDK